MGVLAAATVACSGTIDEPVTDFSEVDRLAQSKENLLRAVVTEKELMITDLSVIESAAQTEFDPTHPSGYYLKGAWSFGRLIHNMLPAGSRDDSMAASQFAFHWLKSWETNQAPNAGVTVATKRPQIRSLVIDPWKAASGCTGSDETCVLDMSMAPFRLIAIVYRPDLRKAPTASNPGHGGEGRFVFNLLDAAGKPIKETVIFEYSLPIWSELGTLTWAYRFHLMGSIPFGHGFNNILALITNGFAGPGADARRPNGNALNQLRTNELVLVHGAGCASPAVPPALCPPASTTPKSWELREFRISGATNNLEPSSMAQEPSRDFDVLARSTTHGPIGNGSKKFELADYLLANADAIRAGKHTIPRHMLANSSFVGSGAPAWGNQPKIGPDGLPVRDAAGKVVNENVFKTAAGVRVPEDVRQGFALNTCAGCHKHEANPATGAVPTATFFHIYDPRALDPAENLDQPFIAAAAGGRETGLSDFVVKEIQVGGPRYNDLTSLLASPFSVAGFKGHKVCRGHDDLDG